MDGESIMEKKDGPAPANAVPVVERLDESPEGSASVTEAETTDAAAPEAEPELDEATADALPDVKPAEAPNEVENGTHSNGAEAVENPV